MKLNHVDHGYPKGWDSLVTPIIEKCEEKGLTIMQIKEKYGGLQFYYAPLDDEVDAMVDAAEKQSYRTCEVCGGPGMLRGGGWWQTLCDEHAGGREILNIEEEP